jgi:hypothetical protein
MDIFVTDLGNVKLIEFIQDRVLRRGFVNTLWIFGYYKTSQIDLRSSTTILERGDF